MPAFPISSFVTRNGRSAAAALALGFAVATMSAASHAGDSLVGKIVAIKSASQVTMDYGAGQVDIVINGIEIDRRDTLERDARAALADLVLGKVVRLRFDGYLPGGEMSGRLRIGAIGGTDERVRDVGVELVRAGKVRAAKGYPKYKYGEMTRAEAEAINTRRGVWQ